MSYVLHVYVYIQVLVLLVVLNYTQVQRGRSMHNLLYRYSTGTVDTLKVPVRYYIHVCMYTTRHIYVRISATAVVQLVAYVCGMCV